MSTAKIKERHIDRLLAEELESSSHFALWFSQKVFHEKPPPERPEKSKTIISHHREDRFETDVRVELQWPGHVRIIHIEDKINAKPQPDQAQHYKDAIKCENEKLDEDGMQGIVQYVLVCPESWILRYPKECEIYPVKITFEEIAEEFERRAEKMDDAVDEYQNEIRQRLLWRSSLLDGSMRQKTTYEQIAAGDITDWNQCAAEIIRAENGLELEVKPRQRSTSGYTKPGRFFSFDETLTAYNDHRPKPTIKLKTLDKEPGRVSLEIPHAGDDLDLEEEAKVKGYDVGSTSTGTLMIGKTKERLKKINLDEAAADQIGALRDAAEIALELIHWWQSRN